MNATININKLVDETPECALPWVHAFVSLLCAKAQASKPTRDLAWQQKYDDVVNRIHDERLSQETAERITNAIMSGALSDQELDHWIEDAQEAVDKYNADPSDRYGRRTRRDTINARLKGLYETEGWEWKPLKGREVGTELFTEPQRPRRLIKLQDGRLVDFYKEMGYDE
ncbi:MAG: hypothetical protein IJU03_08365 [Thermoguttaceae bacterium]|nr:hypothetical protein [Thermoguttaceae bacterium]